MRIGYQGEAHSYSYRAVGEIFPDADKIGYASFIACFNALDDGSVDLLVLPVENSTTGSVLPVLDRLAGAEGRGPVSISVVRVAAVSSPAGSRCQVFLTDRITGGMPVIS